jgi:hypothetical protein
MLLIKELLAKRDLKIRMHLRAAMELSGLKRILDKHLVLDHSNLRRLIHDHYEDAEADALELADQMKEEVRMNFSDPRGCFDAILENTDGRALDFFASTLKHLLLVPTEPEQRMRHFQLIERLVSAVVTATSPTSLDRRLRRLSLRSRRRISCKMRLKTSRMSGRRSRV